MAHYGIVWQFCHNCGKSVHITEAYNHVLGCPKPEPVDETPFQKAEKLWK